MPKLDGDRKALEDYFENTWTLTEVLFSGLRTAAFYEPATHGLRHPLVFYYAHPAALAINKLRVAGLRQDPLDPHYERLFETGVDEMRWDDVVDLHKSPKWPSLDDVVQYRSQVRDVMLDVIRHHPSLDHHHVGGGDVSPQDTAAAQWCIALICEHERIHLETSSVLIRELDLDFIKERPNYWPADHPGLNGGSSSTKPRSFRKYSGQGVTLGKARTEPTFGWDNEFGEKTVNVEPFEATDLVTNGEFLEFLKAGGYSDPQYWTETGWNWRSFRNIKWPHFWVPRGPSGLHEYDLRLPFEVVPFQPDLPAEVNAHEARAYGKWQKASLMTEAQYRAVRIEDDTLDFQGDDPALADATTLRKAGINLNLAFGSPSPVKPRESLGNVWQWCHDDFEPLPGFRTHFLYEDFSVPCFDGEHTIIHGGSFVSTGNEASKFARFHFRPHFHQHAGFRLTRGLQQDEGHFKYESDAQVSAYLDLHVQGSAGLEGPAESEGLEKYTKFPQRCASIVTELAEIKGRALDVGCAVGGSSFKMAEDFHEVVGLDFSQKFIDVATALANGDAVPYARPQVAGLTTPQTAQLAHPVPNVSFIQGDACKDLAQYGTFDAVLCANLLCRLPEPQNFVASLPAIVNPRGVVLFASPFSWMSQYTPDSSSWYRSPEDLAVHMTSLGFTKLHHVDMPLLIRDHARKFQLIFSNALAFRFTA